MHGGLRRFELAAQFVDLATQLIALAQDVAHAEQVAGGKAVRGLGVVELSAHEAEAFELRVNVHQFTREHGKQLLDGQRCPVVAFPSSEGARIDAADLGGGFDAQARTDEAQVTQGAARHPDR